VCALEQALQRATSRAADAEERSQLASAQFEIELAGVRAGLEARNSELEAVRLRLTELEDGWARSKAEADRLRALTTTGFINIDEDRIPRGLVEHIRALEAEIASLQWSEKDSEDMETRNEG
jgi:hypothetical protein